MKFEVGNPGGGRPPGIRNRLSGQFLRDLLLAWERDGVTALKIMAREQPAEFCRMMDSILPKELEVTTNSAISELKDDELDEMIQRLRSEIGATPVAKVQ